MLTLCLISFGLDCNERKVKFNNISEVFVYITGFLLLLMLFPAAASPFQGKEPGSGSVPPELRPLCVSLRSLEHFEVCLFVCLLACFLKSDSVKYFLSRFFSVT